MNLNFKCSLFFKCELDTLNKLAKGLCFNREYKTFEELVEGKPTLFLFVPQNTCFQCYREQILEIKNYQELLGDRFKIIGSYQDIRSLFILFNESKSNCEVINFKSTELGLDDSIENQLFFFVSNQDHIISFLFVPIKGKSEYTRIYLEHFLSRYLKVGGLL